VKLRSLKQIRNLSGKRILVRVDFNVPLSRKRVVDDSRLQAVLPTINYLLEKKARIILISHLGRPQGKDKRYSLAPLARYLTKLVNREVKFLDWSFEKIKSRLNNNNLSQIVLLENLRFFPEEEKNGLGFAKKLAELAEIYVNDAFSVSHRIHASVVGITKYLPSYAGFLLEKEVKVLSSLLEKPKKPFVVLLGGAKISDKIGVIKNLVKKADKILLGGALINNFYQAMGYKVGSSLVEKEGVKLANQLLKNKKILLPQDVVVGTKDGKKVKVVKIEKEGQRRFFICSKEEAILDIGPKTILEYANYLKKAKTLVWNGPMGLYEVKTFSHGTLALARLFASRSQGLAFGVAGGGETIDALNRTGMREYVDWVSTGGGAMLEFLAGKLLPGIKPLIRKK
jgi:phosphoglycerate kinase